MKDDWLKFWEMFYHHPVCRYYDFDCFETFAEKRSGNPTLFRSCLELERDKQVSKQSQQTFFRSWVDGGEVAGDEVFEKSLP